MNRREFVEAFVLAEARSGLWQSSVGNSVARAEAAWQQISSIPEEHADVGKKFGFTGQENKDD